MVFKSDKVKMYHLGNVYMKGYENHISFEDLSEKDFLGWETSLWIALAEEKELIYGHYSEDSGDAEFIHIKNGKCVREYRVYDFEVDTDEGMCLSLRTGLTSQNMLMKSYFSQQYNTFRANLYQ